LSTEFLLEEYDCGYALAQGDVATQLLRKGLQRRRVPLINISARHAILDPNANPSGQR
jgi:hypothetical protein